MKALKFYDKGTISRDIEDLHSRFPDAGKRKIAWYYVKELLKLHEKATPSIRDNPNTRGCFTGLAKNAIRTRLGMEFPEKPKMEFVPELPAPKPVVEKQSLRARVGVFFGKLGKGEGLATE